MTTTLFQSGRSQAERLPKEPVTESTWPKGYFEAIRIEDEAFQRPDQGAMPPKPWAVDLFGGGAI